MWNVWKGTDFHEIEGIVVTGANPEMDSPHNLVTRHRHGTILILFSFTLYSISSMKVVPLLPESANNSK